MSEKEVIPFCNPFAGATATAHTVPGESGIIDKVTTTWKGETVELTPEMFCAIGTLFDRCETGTEYKDGHFFRQTVRLNDDIMKQRENK